MFDYMLYRSAVERARKVFIVDEGNKLVYVRELPEGPRIQFWDLKLIAQVE